MTDETIKEIFNAGDVTGRVKNLEDCRKDHENRIHFLEIVQAHTDEKLDTIINKLDDGSNKKVAYIAGAICGAFSLVGVVAEIILAFVR
jgi:hypothetical protein